MHLKGCCSAHLKWCCSSQNQASLSCFWRSVFQNIHVCVLILLHMPDYYKHAACKFVATWVTSWPWSRQNQTWPLHCSASTSSCLWTIAWQQFKKSKSSTCIVWSHAQLGDSKFGWRFYGRGTLWRFCKVIHHAFGRMLQSTRKYWLMSRA